MKKISGFIVFIFCAVIDCPPLHSQSDYSANYINSIFFSNRLSVIRTSYDRWQSLMKTYHPDKEPWEFNSHIYGASYDFNWAKDKNGKVVTPMMFGLALGREYIGPYFLASTTDFSNFFRNETVRKLHHFPTIFRNETRLSLI